MKFYNRERELQKLAEIAELAADSAHMLVVTGRRRIGKTELVRQFLNNREDALYLFVSKKKPQVLLDEFRDLVAVKIPLAANVTFRNFDDFFSFIFQYLKEHSLIIILDEFQNFRDVDASVFTVLQRLWDTNKNESKGMFIFIGSVLTLMKNIFEGSQEPLFGRATARMVLDPLPPDAVAAILNDHRLQAPASLLFFHTLFGGVPKYYFLLDRYKLFKQPPEEIIRRLFVEADAPLQNEGRELLIEEFGKNYHLYFSILQVVASGETQMARIADRTGINVNSISKYLDELTNFYQILERRLPVTDYREGKKRGRYYLRDQTLRFWFRYIFRNRTLIEIGDEDSLIRKILEGLPTLMGRAFEELVRSLLLRKNDTPFLPFRFNRIGAFWSRRGDVEMDIVALDDGGGKVLFGECKLAGHKVTRADIQRLREKARHVKWLAGSRQEYYALFSAVTMPYAARAALAAEGVIIYDLPQLLAQANAVYQKPEEESQNGTVLFFNRGDKG